MATKKATKKKSAAKKSSSENQSQILTVRRQGCRERNARAMKQGKLKSGRGGKKVTSRKQAIAIGLSEARKEGKKVPQKKS